MFCLYKCVCNFFTETRPVLILYDFSWWVHDAGRLVQVLNIVVIDIPTSSPHDTQPEKNHIANTFRVAGAVAGCLRQQRH